MRYEAARASKYHRSDDALGFLIEEANKHIAFVQRDSPLHRDVFEETGHQHDYINFHCRLTKHDPASKPELTSVPHSLEALLTNSQLKRSWRVDPENYIKTQMGLSVRLSRLDIAVWPVHWVRKQSREYQWFNCTGQRLDHDTVEMIRAIMFEALRRKEDLVPQSCIVIDPFDNVVWRNDYDHYAVIRRADYWASQFADDWESLSRDLNDTLRKFAVGGS